ncbi:ROK family protein [Glaciibacter superstes]|uniref:ROK family protein n=1 Tax=Glaciibacter superstes TaxID=501023 RepID=UPI0003B4FBD3|nr:ROK family protein [Glaciibacter superstes]
MTDLAVGIDIGGTKTAVGLVTRTGEVIARLDAPTPANEGGDSIVSAASSLAHTLLHGRTVIGVGVGAAGVIDSVARRVVSATGSLSNWAGTDLGRAFEAALDLPVVVQNDVHAHAAGEAFVGAGRGHGTVLVAAVGTGIGGAVVVDGQPQFGAHGVAGHLGHLPAEEAAGILCPCGREGHLEAIASGTALHELYLRLGGDADVQDAREVVRRTDNDQRARTAVVTSARALGRCLGGLVNVIDPDIVIIAGGMRRAGALWWSSVEEAMRTTAMPLVERVPLVEASLGDDAAIIGAARGAFESLEAVNQ